MSTIRQFEPAGELIGRYANSQHIPPWGMYVIGGICLLGALPFFYESLPALRGVPLKQLNGGEMLPVVGLVLAALGLGAIWMGRITGPNATLALHHGGILIETGRYQEYFPYDILDNLVIEIHQPSERVQALATFSGILSLLVGNWSGIGRAMAHQRSVGIVRLQLPDGEKFQQVVQIDDSLKRAARIAAEARCEQVLNYLEVGVFGTTSKSKR